MPERQIKIEEIPVMFEHIYNDFRMKQNLTTIQSIDLTLNEFSRVITSSKSRKVIVLGLAIKYINNELELFDQLFLDYSNLTINYVDEIKSKINILYKLTQDTTSSFTVNINENGESSINKSINTSSDQKSLYEIESKNFLIRLTTLFCERSKELLNSQNKSTYDVFNLINS